VIAIWQRFRGEGTPRDLRDYRHVATLVLDNLEMARFNMGENWRRHASGLLCFISPGRTSLPIAAGDILKRMSGRNGEEAFYILCPDGFQLIELDLIGRLYPVRGEGDEQ
jgi:hypothetical protein